MTHLKTNGTLRGLEILCQGIKKKNWFNKCSVQPGWVPQNLQVTVHQVFYLQFFSVNLIPWASAFKKIRFVNVQNLGESKVNKLPVENNVFFFLWNYYTYDQLLCTKNIFHPTLFYIYTYQWQHFHCLTSKMQLRKASLHFC